MGEKRIPLSLGCTSGLATPDSTISRRDAIVLHAYRETDTSRMFRESPQTGVCGGAHLTRFISIQCEGVYVYESRGTKASGLTTNHRGVR